MATSTTEQLYKVSDQIVRFFLHSILYPLLGVTILIEQLHTMMAFRKSKSFEPDKDIGELTGKVVLVTGGNAGLGEETILQLAKHNPAHIYMGARSASKAEKAITDIKAKIPDATITHLPLDLASFESIRAAVDTFQKNESRLDILVNNAGVMAGPLAHTKEGYEIQFGTNHLGHFLLTKLLLSTLLRTAEQPGADVRVVTLSSLAHTGARSGLTLDQEKLGQQITWVRYSQSKLANLLFAKELARRYPSITSVSVHPGLILTSLWGPGEEGNMFLRIGTKLFGGLWSVGVPEGAKNQLWAATASKGKDGVESGQYYIPVGTLSKGTSFAQDGNLAKELWDWSEEEVKKHNG